MKCPKCKAENPNKANFCHMCGSETSRTNEFLLASSLIVLVICVIVGTCVWTLRKINHQNSVTATYSFSQSPTEHVRTIVQDLCNATLNHDFSRLEQLYANNVSRFHDRQNLSNSEVLEMHRKYDKQFGVYNKTISVRWDTFQASWRNYDGHTSITYIIDYHIDREDKSKYSYFVIKKHIELNRDYRIVSEYDEQLSKSNSQ